MEFVLKILKGVANQGFLIALLLPLVLIIVGYLKSNETDKLRSAV